MQDKICVNITMSSINPYFGTENANHNRYKEDIVNIPQKSKGTEGISLTCKDIAISRIVISRFDCTPQGMGFTPSSHTQSQSTSRGADV